MPPRPKETAFRSLRPLFLSSQHPTRDEPRHVLAGSHDPDRSYHSTLSLSPDGRVDAPMGRPCALAMIDEKVGDRRLEVEPPQTSKELPRPRMSGRGIVWFIRADCQIRERDFKSGRRSGPTSRNARP